MSRTRRLALAVLAAVTLTGCTVGTADASTPLCHSVGGRADRHCTPGAINPQVTQANIATTVCRKGWTKTVRPPTSYTSPLKRKQMRQYGDTGPASGFELDHLIPLVLGGSPTDPRNLWPQPRAATQGAAAKDVQEVSLAKAVCNGRMKLADARRKIVADWTG